MLCSPIKVFPFTLALHDSLCFGTGLISNPKINHYHPLEASLPIRNNNPSIIGFKNVNFPYLLANLIMNVKDAEILKIPEPCMNRFNPVFIYSANIAESTGLHITVS